MVACGRAGTVRIRPNESAIGTFSRRSPGVEDDRHGERRSEVEMGNELTSKERFVISRRGLIGGAAATAAALSVGDAAAAPNTGNSRAVPTKPPAERW